MEVGTFPRFGGALLVALVVSSAIEIAVGRRVGFYLDLERDWWKYAGAVLVALVGVAVTLRDRPAGLGIVVGGLLGAVAPIATFFFAIMFLGFDPS